MNALKSRLLSTVAAKLPRLFSNDPANWQTPSNVGQGAAFIMHQVPNDLPRNLTLTTEKETCDAV